MATTRKGAFGGGSYGSTAFGGGGESPPAGGAIIPDPALLTITTFAPIVTADALTPAVTSDSVIPGGGRLKPLRWQPRYIPVHVPTPVVISPLSTGLRLTAYAPIVKLPVTVRPATASLKLRRRVPRLPARIRLPLQRVRLVSYPPSVIAEDKVLEIMRLDGATLYLYKDLSMAMDVEPGVNVDFKVLSEVGNSLREVTQHYVLQ